MSKLLEFSDKSQIDKLIRYYPITALIRDKTSGKMESFGEACDTLSASVRIVSIFVIWYM